MRLADRRGLLSGTRLSRVQSASLEALEVLEEALRAREAGDRLKLALLTNDPQKFSSLFPGATSRVDRLRNRRSGVAPAEPVRSTITEEDLDDDSLDLVFTEEPDMDQVLALSAATERAAVEAITPTSLRGEWR